MSFRPSRRFAIAGTLTAALVVAGGGVAWATGVGGVPDASGVIHACYVTDGGLKPVLLADSSKVKTCPKGWSPLAFSQTGPQGPQGLQGIPGVAGASGAAGPQGAPGSPGAAGASGISGYEIVTADTTGMNGGDDARAYCPSGKHALGGGATVSGQSTAVGQHAIVTGSAPILGGIAWEATIEEEFTYQMADALDRGNDFFGYANPFTTTVWVVCAATS